MTNIIISQSGSRETFTDSQVREITKAITKAVEAEMSKQYKVIDSSASTFAKKSCK